MYDALLTYQVGESGQGRESISTFCKYLWSQGLWNWVRIGDICYFDFHEPSLAEDLRLFIDLLILLAESGAGPKTFPAI
jgi:hypothetical protein